MKDINLDCRKQTSAASVAEQFVEGRGFRRHGHRRQDQRADRVVRFSEDAVGRGVMDAVAAGVVFWPHQLRHTGQQKRQHGEKNDASERMFEKTGHACLLKVRIHGVDGNVALSVCSENDDEQNERVEDRPAYCSRALCQQRAHGLAFFVDHAHDEHDQQCHSNDHEVKLVNTERLEERIVKDGECKSGDHGAEHLHTCKLSPISGDIFLFFGKNRQSVKILRWDGDGFLLYYKRLEGGSFELPTFNPHTGNYEISYQVLSFILNGVSLKSVRLRKRFRI